MPRCAEVTCGTWRPERLAPRWAAGLRLNGHWYCSRTCVELAARAGLGGDGLAATASSSLRPLRLGVLLRHLKAATERDIAAALESQRVSGRRLGAELVAAGRLRPEPLLRALAAQGSVSYLPTFDVTRVQRAPMWLPAETVRALGLVPFDVDTPGRRVHVICGAPVPRSAVRAMQTLTGYVPEVYLVSDDTWLGALAAYGSADQPPRDGHVLTVGGLQAAAALVADAASSERAVTMRHAQWDRFTWVRVEGPSQVANVLVPEAMEGTCQAAFTAH